MMIDDEALDQWCSAHFTYRTLIEAGDTWQRLRVVNRPSQSETWAAIRQLATDILDPVVDRFGPIIITYGFASAALTRHIRASIDTTRDQHAGHEQHANGMPMCPRLGQAVDFRANGVSSGLIAIWIARCLPFDRLYYYGPDKPLHVSVGPQQSRAIVEMMAGPSGRRIPHRRDVGRFIERHEESR